MKNKLKIIFLSVVLVGCGTELSFHKALWDMWDSGEFNYEKSNLKTFCSLGVMEACNDLGVLEYEEGNSPEARRLWEKACDAGVWEGCQNLRMLDKKEWVDYGEDFEEGEWRRG